MKEKIIIKGDIKDVCAELEEENRKYNGITVGKWLRLRKLKQIEEQQLQKAFSEAGL